MKNKSKNGSVKIIRLSPALSKREFFAISVLPKIWEQIDIKPQNTSFNDYAESAAKAAYALADAMIKNGKIKNDRKR